MLLTTISVYMVKWFSFDMYNDIYKLYDVSHFPMKLLRDRDYKDVYLWRTHTSVSSPNVFFMDEVIRYPCSLRPL